MSVTIREPGSAITHFIGMMMAIIASTIPLSVWLSWEVSWVTLCWRLSGGWQFLVWP